MLLCNSGNPNLILWNGSSYPAEFIFDLAILLRFGI